MRLGDDESLELIDGNAEAGGALYVRDFMLEDGLAQLALLTGNGLNVYYQIGGEDAYLEGGTYDLTGGGVLAPITSWMGVLSATGASAVPEPTSLAALAGFAAAALLRRRCRNAA